MRDDATTLEVSTYICSLDRKARKAGVQFRMGEDFEEYLSIRLEFERSLSATD